jgi:hypothetical protein
MATAIVVDVVTVRFPLITTVAVVLHGAEITAPTNVRLVKQQ